MGFDPATAAMALTTAASVAGGILGNNKNQETKIQKKQRTLIDQVLSSLDGEGPFSDIFNFDQAAFDKSFVQPAKSRFTNQIAPAIQQQSIASGQQRGTPLEDQLLRAGVEMDQLLNSNFLDFQERGKNRSQNAISGILGMGAGAPAQQSTGQAASQAGASVLTSDLFGDAIKEFTGFLPKGSGDKTPNRQGFSA